ncbi:hypothetical protein [Paenibacillus sp. GP183]|uniref:hypothetical protein n=1 Tax=Paenibacillus sp. GP183 TaxID=1882751 RepID=UPI000899C005|nr:hypothetical protein [Paenibacillus sp. GP183]SEC81832.1 hypothetical protein SAMN05443246_5485 [Paenibacillus sp. GP183]
MKRKVVFVIFLVIMGTSLILNIGYSYNIHNLNGTNMRIHSSLEQDVKRLSEKLASTSLIIENLKSENDKLTANYKYITGNLHTMQVEDEANIYKIRKIIDNLPGVSKKLAFIKELRNEKGVYYLVFDYVNWFHGDDAKKAAQEDNNPNAASLSNNFYIRNEIIENDKVVLRNDAMIYELNGALLKYIAFNDFVSEKTNLVDRLFNIVIVTDKITLLEEQYRP